jgi:hypothetical protein
MGAMRFLLHPPGRISPDDAQRCYLVGPDQAPWRRFVQANPDELIVERTVSDSGVLWVPWRLPGRGQIMLATATLMERGAAYHLGVELARGLVHQLRNQAHDWSSNALAVPDEFREQLRAATARLSEAVTQQADVAAAADRADEALVVALEAAETLLGAYAAQNLTARQASGDLGNLFLGTRLADPPTEPDAIVAFETTFQAAIVPMTWREIEPVEGQFAFDVIERRLEWCESRGLKVFGGPLLRLDSLGVPDWLALWEGNPESLKELLTRFVEQIVTRFRGRVAVWQCASRINLGDAFRMGEEERLRLTVHTVECARRADPRANLALAFDQPWAEYMGRQEALLGPFDFADALVRASLGLGGLFLELNVGYAGGVLPRTLLAFSRLIDHWSLLGLPLYVTLAVPSDEGPDPAAARGPALLPSDVAAGWNPAAQARWLHRLVPLFLSKPAVKGVFYGALRDTEPHELPHGGLIDASGVGKPALATLARLRGQWLA